VTHHFASRQLRFFLTAPAPCPYLPEKVERKVFAHLPMADGPTVNDTLTQIGFRRSQNIAYRPSCEGCDACVSARIPVNDYVFSRSERRVLDRNQDAQRQEVKSEATAEQFALLRRYLSHRHSEGGMADMTWPDFVAMVEDTSVRTHMVEYRLPPQPHASGELIACALVDELADGLSLVYSFYNPEAVKRSLGSFIILDHIQQAQAREIPRVYLGYWVKNSHKMAYKARFNPLEILRPNGWVLMSARDRDLQETSPQTP
jgi:leucyl-tRNA---protein transferase